jgi:DNA-binding transcriptional LysR family regulator
MDQLECMTVLAAVVDAGSLSAAGRKLGMPLPTVSRKLSELEAHLKTRLLLRSTRGLQPTDAGRAYVAQCRRILEAVDQADRQASGEFASPRGELTVTAPVVFGRLHVLPVAVGFLKAFPEVDLRLVLADRVMNLREEEIDLAVRIGALADSSMVAVEIGKIGRVICASPAYLAKRGEPRTPADLASHDCITFDGPPAGAAWTPHSRLTVNTAEAALDAAMAGLGITRVLSYQADEALRSGKLREVLASSAPAPVPASLLHASGRLVPAKLRAFLDHAVPRLRERLQPARTSPLGPRSAARPTAGRSPARSGGASRSPG